MGDAWFFDRFAAVYDRVMMPADPETIEPGFDMAATDVDSVLDVAGGTGRIARSVLPKYDATVLDLSRAMLMEARRYGLACVQGDAAQMPVPDESIDAVVIADAYHHFPAPADVLADVERVLRPGGVVVIREFDPTTLRGRGVMLSERLLGWPAAFRTPDGLCEDLDAAGFEPSVTEGGFGYTVTGSKPETPTTRETESDT